jgi:hypothetical protein
VAIIGAFLQWRQPRNETKASRQILWPCYGAFLFTWLTVLQVALFMHWGWSEGGRYLFPAFIGFSLFLARGYLRLLGEKGTQLLTLSWFSLGISLNALSLWWLLSYLNPTFGPQ